MSMAFADIKQRPGTVLGFAVVLHVVHLQAAGAQRGAERRPDRLPPHTLGRGTATSQSAIALSLTFFSSPVIRGRVGRGKASVAT